MSAKITHGHYVGGRPSPTYVSWQNMHTRCSNENDPTYPKYGGAGVTVCKRWNKFESFLADMGERPPGTTLDRKENSKGYSKSNCRWATRQEQARNRGTSILLSQDSGVRCIAEVARAQAAVDTSTVYRRLKSGWSTADALSLPAHPSITFEGRTQSVAAWAREVGIARGTIKARIQRGWSVSDALHIPTGA